LGEGENRELGIETARKEKGTEGEEKEEEGSEKGG